MNKFRLYSYRKNNSIQTLILNELHKVIHDFTRKKEMTRAVKLALVKLGHKLEFKVYARVYTDEYWSQVRNYNKISDEIGIRKDTFKNKEWLYDVHWYTDISNPDKDNALHYMPQSFELACECEWSKNKAKSWKQNIKDIGYDFQKLLFSNAHLNVFICRCHKEIEIQNLAKYFVNAVQNFENLTSGAQFLMACFMDGKLFYLKIKKI